MCQVHNNQLSTAFCLQCNPQQPATIQSACAGQFNLQNAGANPALAQRNVAIQSNYVTGQLGGQYATLGYAPGNTIITSSEYDEFLLFKKYAYLTDAELMETYLNEHKDILAEAESRAKIILDIAAQEQEIHKKIFSEWCSKYRKNITVERINNLKAFL